MNLVVRLQGFSCLDRSTKSTTLFFFGTHQCQKYRLYIHNGKDKVSHCSVLLIVTVL